MKRGLLLLLFWGTSVYGQTPFSLDSAASYLHTIAKDIGPRPMGSPNERRAMEFGLTKFREFGMTEVAILPMNVTTATSYASGTNTQSGTAYGILPGMTGRIIVLGAHIDSDNPDVPGANDDGSGSASVIELARILSQRNNESTIVFALFGGEEQGLRGSSHFVEYFPRIGDVALMIQLDMTNGSEWLLPLIDGGEGKRSPKWLVEAAYEEFNKLGYRTLSFPNHFMTFNSSLPGGGAGSDHMPFLRNDIPAIDFTTNLTDPIHTPQDSYENFKLDGLKRTGDLVYSLVERFDGGVPEETHDSYYLSQLGSVPLFFPQWLLKVFIGLAVILTAVALVMTRRRREIEEVRQKIPGLKLFAAMLIIQTCVWLSENVVGLIKGDRYPWFADFEGYFILGLLGGIIGIWISLQLTRGMGLTPIAYRYYLRAVVFLVIFLLLMSISSTHLALYPALAMFFLALAMLVRPWWLKLLLWGVSPYFMVRLIFTEYFGLMARMMAAMGPESFLGSALIHIFYILFFSLWAFPFLLGFAAVFFDTKKNLLWLEEFRKMWGGIGAFAAFVACVVVLAVQPSLTPEWNQRIRIDQHLNQTTGEGYTTVSSGEYLDGTRIVTDTSDTLITSRILSLTLGNLESADEWIKTVRTVNSDVDTSTTLDIMLNLTAAYRPYTLTVTYSTATGTIASVSSPYFVSQTLRSATLKWYSFPEKELLIPVSITLAGTDSVKEEIEAVFVEQFSPIDAVKDLATTTHRTTVRTVSTLRPASTGNGDD